MTFIDGVASYTAEVRRASRVRRPPVAPPDAPAVDADRIWWWRLAAAGAVRRLPAGSVADAAHGGLQDSAPRAALLALHARVHDVGPDGWDHPDLVQVWLRWADYVVPRRDLGVFTLGASPRDPAAGRALDELAAAVLDAMGGAAARTGVVAERLGLAEPVLLRAVAVTGAVAIRWDARTTELVPVTRPEIEPEDARLELSRRFLHWQGPATVDHLARWAGVTRADAEATWAALRPELVPVAVDGRERWMLSDDLDALLAATRPTGTRLLPAGDPCLFMTGDLAHGPPKRSPDPAVGITPRLANSLTGRIVDDGVIVGAWARAGTAVTIDPWAALPAERTEAIDRAAQALAAPLGAPVDVRWLPPRRP
ncbi:MAG: crosslink repair DNA glycosylase YcaQ family protein [Actinomycetota bacterium]|nr:crosslink repair DNA glycosylase YcaQ family protein [Actinomycetota bacterium]